MNSNGFVSALLDLQEREARSVNMCDLLRMRLNQQQLGRALQMSRRAFRLGEHIAHISAETALATQIGKKGCTYKWHQLEEKLAVNKLRSASQGNPASMQRQSITFQNLEGQLK